MPGLNKGIVIGHLGRDPEQKTLPSGNTVTNFSVGVTEKRKGEDETTWVDISAWGQTGEYALKYLKKGGAVYIEGKMRVRAYMGKDGEPKAVLSLDTWNITSLGSPKQAAQQSQNQQGYGNAGPGQQQQQAQQPAQTDNMWG